MATPDTTRDIERHAQQVLNQMVGLPADQALSVLSVVMHRLATDKAYKLRLRKLTRVLPVDPNLILGKRGRRSRVTSDPEVLDFVVAHMDKPQIELARMCREKFGPDRAPSRYAISRFRVQLAEAFHSRGKK